ncbi:MAG: glycoside hydrolase family 31 protein [Clostridiales bacterium]|nr:glycoside hydrolase family 31 protein [Clostridiales bacterium]
MKTAFEPGEVWWGGASAGRYPIKETDTYTENLIDCSTSAGNQAMPFFVSSHGRYVWSDTPFTVTAQNGVLSFEGGEPRLVRAGDSLKDAYLAAQKAHFPCNGRKLPEVFFQRPQLNTWMEFTYYVTQESVLDFARSWLDNGFEPGVFIIDEGWERLHGIWEFDAARFPDPKAMVRQLHEWGFTVMLWVVPYVCPVGPEFVRSLRPLVGTDPEMARHLYLRSQSGETALFAWWNGYAALLDMTDEYNRKFLSDQLERLMREYGVDGFKFDGGSVNAYSPSRLVNGPLNRQISAQELNMAWNEFGAKYALHEFKDTWGLGGKNMIQRLRDKKHEWDTDGLASIVPGAINAGLMGFPFICPDMVGGGEWKYRFMPGFSVDEELFVRMAQCSALFPMMQFSWAPWKALKPENLRLCLEAARLHEKMYPEIMKAVNASMLTGEPVIRALEYECPRRGLETVIDEFMVGSDILVAPVVKQGAVSRRVAFPDSKWLSPDGTVYDGLTSTVISAPLDTLLWFRRYR